MNLTLLFGRSCIWSSGSSCCTRQWKARGSEPNEPPKVTGDWFLQCMFWGASVSLCSEVLISSEVTVDSLHNHVWAEEKPLTTVRGISVWCSSVCDDVIGLYVPEGLFDSIRGESTDGLIGRGKYKTYSNTTAHNQAYAANICTPHKHQAYLVCSALGLPRIIQQSVVFHTVSMLCSYFIHISSGPCTDNVLLNITMQYFIICLWVWLSNVLSDKRDLYGQYYCFELTL
jgi:hypothetical protein